MNKKYLKHSVLCIVNTYCTVKQQNIVVKIIRFRWTRNILTNNCLYYNCILLFIFAAVVT